MKVFSCDTWAELSRWSTDAGDFHGLAIGPESEEGIVRVGELVLQAGRVLALASSGGPYTFTRYRVPRSTFAEISRLQIVAYECQAELAAEVARPTITYSSSIAGVDVAASAWDTVQTVLDVPFVGRRQALLALYNSDVSKIGVKILGRRYNRAKRAVETRELASSAPGDYSGTTIALYVGGTDTAEAWDALRIQAGNTGAADAVVYADVECIGEIGAR